MKFLLLRSAEQIDYANTGSFYGSYYSASVYPPLGLEYIGASLENDGHKVEIIDLCLESVSREHLKNSLMSSDAVGMSVYTDNFNRTLDDARMIKELDSEIPLIIGGPHCTFFQSRSLISIPYADIGVVGEGEYAIIDIVRHLQGHKKLSEIHGIYYRENNQIKSGQSLTVINDLDSLCFPARHLVDKYDYGKMNKLYLYKPRLTSMITSKGCPFKCRFCARYGNVIKNWGFRQRSAENVVKEIIEINDKYGSVMITDDNFLSDKKRAYEIMDRLIENGTNIDLLIEGVRVDAADRELYMKMKKANVKFIAFGIESGNQDVLDFYNKCITLDQIRKAVRLSKEMDFITAATFILGAPIETKKHIEKTIDFGCSLPLDIALFIPFNYQMGSEIWFEEVKNKKISKDEYLVPSDSYRGLGNLTQKELEDYKIKAFRQFYLRPSYMLGQIYRAFLRKDFRLLTNGLRVITSF